MGQYEVIIKELPLFGRVLEAAIGAIDLQLQREKYQWPPTKKATDSEPLRVEIGQVVYYWDEDAARIVHCPVIGKHGRHHYCWIDSDEDLEPRVEAVSEGWFFKTPQEAAKNAAESIAFDVRYHADRARNSAEAAAMISGDEGKSARSIRKRKPCTEKRSP